MERQFYSHLPTLSNLYYHRLIIPSNLFQTKTFFHLFVKTA